MKAIQKFINACDRINEFTGTFIVVPAVFGFILVIFSNVVMRYVFNTSFVFMAELEWHIFSFVFLMGAGFTLLHDGHVRVDVFYSLMDRKKQAFINFFGVLVFLIPSCWLVLMTTVPWAIDAYKIGETSIDPGGIPARFVLKAALPAGYLLMLIQGISLFIKSFFIMIGRPLDNGDDIDCVSDTSHLPGEKIAN